MFPYLLVMSFIVVPSYSEISSSLALVVGAAHTVLFIGGLYAFQDKEHRDLDHDDVKKIKRRYGARGMTW